MIEGVSAARSIIHCAEQIAALQIHWVWGSASMAVIGSISQISHAKHQDTPLVDLEFSSLEEKVVQRHFVPEMRALLLSKGLCLRCSCSPQFGTPT